MPGKDFSAMLNEAGFVEVELVKDTSFNSSPVTKGEHFRAKKPHPQLGSELTNPLTLPKFLPNPYLTDFQYMILMISIA